MTKSGNSRVLVIDDERFIRDLLQDFYSKSGYDVVIAPDGKSGIAEVEHGQFDVALVDLKMPDMTGTDVLAAIQSINPALPVIIMTGYPTVDASIEAIRLGAQDFIVKPFRLQDLKLRLDRAIQSRSVAREVEDLRARVGLLEKELREFRALSPSLR